MFHGASAFNQDISGWDVSKVTIMCSMFRGASAFNQDISGWNVSKLTNTSCIIFDATVLLKTLQTMQTSSFFEGVYRDMPKEKRQSAFAGVFRWQRRRAFLLFLVNHGYLYSASVLGKQLQGSRWHQAQQH